MKLFMVWIDNGGRYEDNIQYIYRCFMVPDDTNTSGLILKFPNLVKTSSVNKEYIDSFCQWLENDMGFSCIPLAEGHIFKITGEEFCKCAHDLNYASE